jgi:Uma2 family endonuclease
VSVETVERYRFTVEQYHRLAEVGILRPDVRVELIDGIVVDVPPASPRHAACVRRMARWLNDRLGTDAFASVEVPVHLGSSEPRPDLSVVRGPVDRDADAHPTAVDVLLLIEVADDSTLLLDREVKSEVYANAGITEYWLVDLTHDTVSVFRSPREDEYTEVQVHRHGQSWTSPALGGCKVRVEDVLGMEASGLNTGDLAATT